MSWRGHNGDDWHPDASWPSEAWPAEANAGWDAPDLDESREWRESDSRERDSRDPEVLDREWRNDRDYEASENEGCDWECAVLPDHVREIVGPRGRVITQIERETLASLEVTSSRGGRVAAVDRNVIVRGSESAKKRAVQAIMAAVQKSDGICRLKLFVPREVGTRALTEGNCEFEKIKWETDGVWVEGTPEGIAQLCAIAFVMERPSEVVPLKVAFPHKLIKKLVGTPDRRPPEFKNILCQIDACYDQVPSAWNPIILRGLQNEKLAALQTILEKLESFGDGVMQVVMVLPKACLKAAIGGTLGQNTLKMEQETSCSIEFAREDQDNVVQSSCKITGPAPENVVEACKLLDDIATREPLALADKDFAKVGTLPLKRGRKEKEKPNLPQKAPEVTPKPVPSVPVKETIREMVVNVLVVSEALNRVTANKLQDIREISASSLDIHHDIAYGKETLVQIKGPEQGIKLALAHLFWELAGGADLDRSAVMIPMHARSRVRAAIPRIEMESETQMQVDPPAPRRPHSRVALRGDPNAMMAGILLLSEFLASDALENGSQAAPPTEKPSENSVEEPEVKRRRTDSVDGEPIARSRGRDRRRARSRESRGGSEKSKSRHVKEDDLVLLLSRDFDETVDVKGLNTKDIKVKSSTIQRRRALTLKASDTHRLEAVRKLCQVLERLGHPPTLTVLLHPWILSTIVGRKGCNVMEAQRTSGCRMDVSRALSTLTISGDYMEQVAFGIEHALALAEES